MKTAFLICVLYAGSGGLYAQTLSCSGIIDSLLKTPPGDISSEQKKQIIPCVYDIQNQGFNFDEKQCKYDSAKIKIEEALKIWKHINDTLNTANLLKYLGYLNGRLGQFSLGKANVAEAIKLFTSKKADYGIAVSQYDLARIYEFENKLDSAIFFTQEALKYWRTMKNPGRIMILNNNFINLYLKKNETNQIANLVAENLNYIKKEQIYWLQELDFYFLSSDYFKKEDDSNNQLKYEELYLKKISALEKSNGYKSYSLFDERNCR